MKKLMSVAFVALMLTSAVLGDEKEILDAAQNAVVQDLGELLRARTPAEATAKKDKAAADKTEAEAEKAKADFEAAKSKRENLEKDLKVFTFGVPDAETARDTAASDVAKAKEKADTERLADPESYATKEAEKAYSDAVRKLCAAEQAFEEAKKAFSNVKAKHDAAWRIAQFRYDDPTLERLLQELITSAIEAESKAKEAFDKAAPEAEAAAEKAAASKALLDSLADRISQRSQSASTNALRGDLQKIGTALGGVKTSLNGVASSLDEVADEIEELRKATSKGFAALVKSNEGVAGEIKKLTEKISGLALQTPSADQKKIFDALTKLNDLLEKEDKKETQNVENQRKIAEAVGQVAKATQAMATKATCTPSPSVANSPFYCWNGCSYVQVDPATFAGPIYQLNKDANQMVRVR